MIVDNVFVSTHSGKGWFEHFIYQTTLIYVEKFLSIVYPSLLEQDSQENAVMVRNIIYYGILKPIARMYNFIIEIINIHNQMAVYCFATFIAIVGLSKLK